MPFDSFMTAALTREISEKLCGLKVDKICQPEKDEIDLLFHLSPRSRLVINCTANTSYMALSSQNKENPAAPPMMCMLLRKYLSRAKVSAIEQIGFDRIVKISFDAGDEMGFRKAKYLYCEMMGRGSNVIFVDEENTILAAFRQNDITTKFNRIVMAGAKFTPMPQQDKRNPVAITFEEFSQVFAASSPDMPIEKAILLFFFGFGKLTAREIAFRAAGSVDAPLSAVSLKKLWQAFSEICACVKENQYAPCLIYESKEAFEKGESALDFSFTEIRQYGPSFYIYPCDSVSAAIEAYYAGRDRAERHRQHYNDIAQVLKTCKNRLEKKIAMQLQQLQDAQDADRDKRCGDLITQELYRICKGTEEIVAVDYAVDPPEEVRISLDPRLSPAQNAQHYYREYRKKQTAAVKMQEQIDLAKSELEYAESVSSSLRHAAAQSDLEQIREELSHWNYGRRLTKTLKKPSGKKNIHAKPFETLSPGGCKIYIGMNNLQNDTVSTSLAEKEDYWFHVKNYHGSHVLLKIPAEGVISDADLEYAAALAAYYSEVSDSDRVEVDYTKARFIKKPNGSKPGFITYKNHRTALVTPKSAK